MADNFTFFSEFGKSAGSVAERNETVWCNQPAKAIQHTFRLSTGQSPSALHHIHSFTFHSDSKESPLSCVSPDDGKLGFEVGITDVLRPEMVELQMSYVQVI